MLLLEGWLKLSYSFIETSSFILSLLIRIGAILRLVEGLVTGRTFVESLEVLQNLRLMHEQIVSVFLVGCGVGHFNGGVRKDFFCHSNDTHLGRR